MKFNLTPQQLKEKESKVFSQSMQDGIIEAIFEQIGNGNKYFVEFGARDGIELSNTANLRLNKGWDGLLMDSEPLSSIVRKEFITAENINSILFKYAAPNIDLLSVDVDGIEPYIFKSLQVIPRVIVIEYNSKWHYDESYAIEYNPNTKWQRDDYYGASLLALQRLGEQKGYTLVYKVAELDAIFIRNDLISPDYVKPTVQELHPEPIIAHDTVSNKKWIKI